MDKRTATTWLKQQAVALGFERCGIAKPDPIGRDQYLRAWLDAGRAGSMAYLHRNLESRIDPARLLPDAKSAIIAALQYYQPIPTNLGGEADEKTRAADAASARGGSPATAADSHASSGPTGGATASGAGLVSAESGPSQTGRVARYAWGRDYHRVIKSKLHKLADTMRAHLGPDISTRTCVDTAPIIERELAARAGIGWIGKNTLVLDPELGSYFVLGVLLTTFELEPDEPLGDHCGSCTACLEACPTDAFPAPYEMDAARCLSYLTIEHRSAIPVEFHRSMGDWVFGCDVCQEVCPFNRRPPATNEPDFAIRPPGPQPKLESILHWTPEEYDNQTRGSATRRATLDMWKRNAVIAQRRDSSAT